MNEASSHTRVVTATELVYPAGLDSWIAGGPYGDPRRPDTKDLRGDVVSGRDQDVLTPLCGLMADNPKVPVTGRVLVRTSLTGFVLNGSKRESDRSADLLKSLKEDEARFVGQRSRAESELRKRVAALAFVKNNRKPNQKEVDLASRAFVFEPDIEEENR